MLSARFSLVYRRLRGHNGVKSLQVTRSMDWEATRGFHFASRYLEKRALLRKSCQYYQGDAVLIENRSQCSHSKVVLLIPRKEYLQQGSCA